MASWTRKFQASHLEKKWRKDGYSGDVVLTKTLDGTQVSGPAPRFTCIPLDVLMKVPAGPGTLELIDDHLKICGQLIYLIFGFDPERTALKLYLTHDNREGQGVRE